MKKNFNVLTLQSSQCVTMENGWSQSYRTSTSLNSHEIRAARTSASIRSRTARRQGSPPRKTSVCRESNTVCSRQCLRRIPARASCSAKPERRQTWTSCSLVAVLERSESREWITGVSSSRAHWPWRSGAEAGCARSQADNQGLIRANDEPAVVAATRTVRNCVDV